VQLTRSGNWSKWNKRRAWDPETVDVWKLMDGHFLLSFMQLVTVACVEHPFQFRSIADQLPMILQSR